MPVVAVYSVDPSTLAVTLQGTVTVPAIGPQDPVALTAGRYLNVGADEIALVVNSTPDGQAEIFSYSVDQTFAITQRGFFAAGLSVPIIAARSGSLDALGGLTAQLVPLGAAPVWLTDTSQQTQFAAWSQGGGAEVTSGTAQTNSYDRTSSATASILGFGGGETVNYSKSSGLSTVFSSVTTVG